MKATKKAAQLNLDQLVDVCVDVGKDTLNVVFEVGAHIYEDEFVNTTAVIETKLMAYLELIRLHNKARLRVVCEPSGAYQDKLLRVARRLGQLTAYVNGESVAKFRVVESNDGGKSDLKDPHIIHTLAKVGKTLEHRTLPLDYELVRKWGKLHDETDTALVQIRCRLHRALLGLFSDYSRPKNWLYTRAGRVLMDQFKGNPYRIVDAGFWPFVQAMKKGLRHVRDATLDQLWADAQASVRHPLASEEVTLLEWHLEHLWAEFVRYDQRKTEIGQHLERLYSQLRQADPHLPEPTKGVISAKNLARLVGETGPLSDFGHWRPLLRYAGLNLCMRQSGQYQGQTKISKKGRPLLRKVLAQIVFPLVRKDQLYGPYYHQKKESMPASKARTAVMRQFLKKLFGWYKSGQAFEPDRYQTCQSQYGAQAA